MQLRTRKLPSGHRSLFLDYTRGGKRHREALGLTLTGDKFEDRETMRLARAILSRRLLDEVSRQHDADFVHEAAPTLRAFAGKVIAGKRGKTAATIGSALVQLGRVVELDAPLSEVGRRDMERYGTHLEATLKPTSARLYFTVIRSLFKLAVRQRLIKGNPADGIRVGRVSDGLQKSVLTDGELAALASTPCRYDSVRRMFLLACMTGLRLVDAMALRYGDVDIEGRMLKVRQRKTGVAVWVPLNDSAVRLIGIGEGKVFPDAPSVATVAATLTAWGRSAGLSKHLTFGVARHTFVSMVLERTGNLKLASSLAGHTSIVTTERYAHVADSQRRAAVEGLPGV